MEYISGVKVRKLRLIPDDRGWLMELVRSDWEEFEKFGVVKLLATGECQTVGQGVHHRRQLQPFQCCFQFGFYLHGSLLVFGVGEKSDLRDEGIAAFAALPGTGAGCRRRWCRRRPGRVPDRFR